MTLCLQLDGSDEIEDVWLNLFKVQILLRPFGIYRFSTLEYHNGVSRMPEANITDLAGILSN